MAPSLSISYGPSPTSLQPLDPNDDSKLHSISTPQFKGRIAVRVKNFTGKGSDGSGQTNSTSSYFSGEKGKWMTYSIQIQGKWLEENGVDGDDLVFGNSFDKPIRDHLPYGTSIALKAASFIDPNLTHDLYCDTPWAFSPLLATMNKVQVIDEGSESKSESESESESSPESGDDFSSWPRFPSTETETETKDQYVKEDISPLFLTKESGYKKIIPDLEDKVGRGEIDDLKYGNSSARTHVLSKPEVRKSLKLNRNHVLNADFCNGFIDFNTLKIELPHTGGWGIDLRKYWDGQPVRYICKNKSTEQIYFVVQFDIIDLDT